MSEHLKEREREAAADRPPPVGNSKGSLLAPRPIGELLGPFRQGGQQHRPRARDATSCECDANPETTRPALAPRDASTASLMKPARPSHSTESTLAQEMFAPRHACAMTESLCATDGGGPMAVASRVGG